MFDNLIRKLKATRNIMGINSRYLDYTRPHNRKIAKRIADDKVRAKKTMQKFGIPVTQTFEVIKNREQLDEFDWESLPTSFALKPARGLGGGGIVVTFNKNKRGNWVGVDGKDITKEDLYAHVLNILDGEFSLGNLPDMAFFEERIKIDNFLKRFSFKGIPDVRIVVYNNVPLMAELRLPTKESRGRANLAQGALGIGVDMATGVTTTAIKRNVLTYFDKLIERHPELNLPLSGIQIPFWDDMLKISIRVQQAVKLGYLGVDIAIDKERGPIVMEVNARPGLSIQNANNEGLLGRLRRVEGIKVESVQKGVHLAKYLFGGEIEAQVEERTGKKVIGTVEKIQLFGKDGKAVSAKVRIDTGARSTSICEELARELGFGPTIDNFKNLELPEYKIIKGSAIIEKKQEKNFVKKAKAEVPDLCGVKIIGTSNGYSVRPVIEIEYIMDKERIKSRVNIIQRKHMLYPALIGRLDLSKKYLIEIDE